MNRKLSIWHFWTFFIFFNLTSSRSSWSASSDSPPVFEYAPNLQTLNDISSVSAFLLGASF